MGAVLSPYSNGIRTLTAGQGLITIGGTAAAPTITLAPSGATLWTPNGEGLIAATADGAMAPSQSAVTTGRLFVYPITIDKSGQIYYSLSAYTSVPADTVTTDTFHGIYASTATGAALLDLTGDLSSQCATTGGKLVEGTWTNKITVTAGQTLAIGFINNYATDTGPTWICTRNFMTNWGSGTDIIPRVLVNSSGSTFASLPSTLPAMTASATNELPAIALAFGP